jgi:hypothetical protein
VAIERVRNPLKIGGIAARRCAKECVIARNCWGCRDVIGSKGVEGLKTGKKRVGSEWWVGSALRRAAAGGRGRSVEIWAGTGRTMGKGSAT